MSSSITATEIASQPTVWARALTDIPTAGAIFGRPGESVLVLGCGTSAFVAESLAILREQAGLGLTDAGYASEWRPGRRYDRVLVISRSGTTSEVLAALDLVEPGTPTAAIVGVADSPGRPPRRRVPAARLRRREVGGPDAVPDDGARAGPSRVLRRRGDAGRRGRTRARRAAARPGGRHRPRRLPGHRVDVRAGAGGGPQGPRGRSGMVGVLPGPRLPARSDRRRPPRARSSRSSAPPTRPSSRTSRRPARGC